MENRHTPKKIVAFIGNVLLYIFIVISIFGVIITIGAKRGEDGTATVFGMQMRHVISPSMEKSEFTNTDAFTIKDIPMKSVVFVEVVPEGKEKAYEWYSSLREGDVLTFRYVYTTQITITHRITKIEEKENKAGFVFYLEGDNKASEMGALTQIIDTEFDNTPNYVIGKVVGKSVVVGLLLSILKSPIGLITVVILPCIGIVVFEIIKIVRVMGMDKKKKEEEEKKKQKDELEELRRRLAELEAAKAQTPSADEPKGDSSSDS